MHHVVRVESSFNPYAIGVVGGRLVRQPRNLPEAVSTARMLEQRGYNFSLGLAQVNRHNLIGYGLKSYEEAFQPCANLEAGSRILAECYGRSRDWGKSFSCYYSGDFKTGYRHGYVQKVVASMRQAQVAQASVNSVAPIEVIDRVGRRTSASPQATPSDPAPAAPSLVERRGLRPMSAIAVPAAATVQSADSLVAAQPPVQSQSHPVSTPPAPVRVQPTQAPVAVSATHRIQDVVPAPQAATSSGDNAFVF